MNSSLSSLVGQPLTWVPTTALKARYDLVAPDSTPLVTLDMSSWTSKATALVPEGTLFLQKEGWSGLRVAIYEGEQGPRIATYQRKWTATSGELLFPDGREFRWGKVNLWGTQKAWTDATGTIAYVQFSSGGFSRKASVVIDPQAAELPELSLLLVLGLYNILIERRGAAAATSSASVSFLR